MVLSHVPFWRKTEGMDPVEVFPGKRLLRDATAMLKFRTSNEDEYKGSHIKW